MNQKIFFLFSVVSYFSYCQCVAPIITNFECGMPTQNILGNGITSISNLYQTGINNSINIGQYTDDGTNGWDNLMFDYSTEIDLSSNPHLSFKLYSPSSIQVMVKLEGGTAVEKWSDFSSINTWEEFNYDFSDAVSNGNTKVVLFFNAGVQTGTTNDVYYIDDIRWSNSTSILPIISDFESLNSSVPMIGDIQKVSNPYHSELNTSTNVGQYTDDGTNGWDNLMFDYSTEIDLSSNPHLSFKLYSPSSIQVMVKLEGGAAVEKWSDFSSINTWEELNYDFSNAVNNSNTKVVLFFNAGVQTGTTNDVYYIDDIKWSSTLSIENSRKIYELTSYPNPVYDIIRLESMININSFVIYDIQGKNLISKKNINKKSVEIDISMLNSGTYFLKNILEKEIKTLKIIKR
ncbi:MAG: T9SS type A sorting domain-containing protein [Flavobacteriaceae bacterium]